MSWSCQILLFLQVTNCLYMFVICINYGYNIDEIIFQIYLCIWMNDCYLNIYSVVECKYISAVQYHNYQQCSIRIISEEHMELTESVPKVSFRWPYCSSHMHTSWGSHEISHMGYHRMNSWLISNTDKQLFFFLIIFVDKVWIQFFHVWFIISKISILSDINYWYRQYIYWYSEKYNSILHTLI